MTLQARAVRYDQDRAFYAGRATGRVVSSRLANGDAGLQQLTDKLQAAVEAGLKKPEAWELAAEWTAHVKPGDTAAEVQAIYDHLAGGDTDIRYVLDPVGVQIITGFASPIMSRRGDCKKLAVLGAILVGSLGCDVRIVTVDQHVGSIGPTQRHHTYFDYQLPGSEQWHPFDPVLALQRQKPRPGQELPYKVKVIHRRPS